MGLTCICCPLLPHFTIVVSMLFSDRSWQLALLQIRTTPLMENQVEKTIENNMETPGPFKAVMLWLHRGYIEILLGIYCLE